MDEYVAWGAFNVIVQVPGIANKQCSIKIDPDVSVVVDKITVNGNGRACRVRDAKNSKNTCMIG